MNVWRWFGSMVFTAGLMVLIGANLSVTAQDKKADEKKTDEKKADDKKAEPQKVDAPKKDEPKKDEPKKEAPVEAGKERLSFKAFDSKTPFYQELVTSTNQEMTVMGQAITQKQKQVFYLKWTPEEKNKDGNYVVTQEIVGLNMNINIGGNTIAYDSSDEKQPANPMTDFFKALLGLKLKLTINPKTMEVVSVEGQDEFIRSLGKANPQMEPLLKSILSKDALQQMAEPTWGALPEKDVAKDAKWSKTSVLKLGPIGTYTTQFTYTYDGKDEKTKNDKILIKSELKYAKPDDKSGLPFIIKEANLASTKGTGVALFDREKGRFAESKMEMELKGELTIDVGGMETKVSLTQGQEATSKTSDDPPAFLNAKKKS